MKVAVTSVGPSLDDQVEPRFGRCTYFLIVDPETMELETLKNPNVAAGGGAGIQSAQLMAERGVQAVLTGNCGPNAFQVFNASGIQVIVGISGLVRQAVEQFKAGVFTEARQANVESRFGTGSGDQGYQTVPLQSSGGYDTDMGGGRGTGRGMGMGGGRGTGRGMGMGGGRGTGRGMGMGGGQGARFVDVSEGQTSQPLMNSKGELTTLEEQARMLQEQLKKIQEQIKKINGKK